VIGVDLKSILIQCNGRWLL